jgi:phosphocarrier protein
MVKEKVEIPNKLGLHARPAVMLVKTSSSFDSDIKIKNGDIEVDGKSIMGILMLAAGKGTVLEIICTGSDEESAAKEIVELIKKGFGEE